MSAPRVIRYALDHGVVHAIQGRSMFSVRWYSDGPFLGSRTTLTEEQVADARELVVIDPEDRAQVERLVAAFRADKDKQSNPATLDHFGRRLQNALRSLIAPPKPGEPTGLGAVVEDDGGRQWIKHVGVTAPWHRADAADGDERPWRYYADIDVAKVLSEGVTP